MNLKVSELFHLLWKNRDIKMDNYFLMNDPIFILTLCFIYVLMAIYIGPLIMDKKKPFNLRLIIIIYNVCMSLMNLSLLIKTWNIVLNEKYNIMCQPMNLSSVASARVFHLYYMSKFVDWFDTIFLVARKKFRNISGLHVYHHFIVPFDAWLLARFTPSGQVISIVILNSFIHTLMYLYYGLSAIGPDMQRYLWWKKYITVLQILQFVAGTTHLALGIYLDCGFPKPMLYYFIPKGFIFFALFLNFYFGAYTRNHSKTK